MPASFQLTVHLFIYSVICRKLAFATERQPSYSIMCYNINSSVRAGQYNSKYRYSLRQTWFWDRPHRASVC